jgi:hypothetical protein
MFITSSGKIPLNLITFSVFRNAHFPRKQEVNPGSRRRKEAYKKRTLNRKKGKRREMLTGLRRWQSQTQSQSRGGRRGIGRPEEKERGRNPSGQDARIGSQHSSYLRREAEEEAHDDETCTYVQK